MHSHVASDSLSCGQGCYHGLTYLAPDDPEASALADSLGLVDIGYPLAQVEVNLLLGLHAVNFDKRNVCVLVALAPAVTEWISFLTARMQARTPRNTEVYSVLPPVPED